MLDSTKKAVGYRALFIGSLVLLSGCQSPVAALKNQATINDVLLKKYAITQVKGDGVQPHAYIVCGDNAYPCSAKPTTASSAVVEKCQPCQ